MIFNKCSFEHRLQKPVTFYGMFKYANIFLSICVGNKILFFIIRVLKYYIKKIPYEEKSKM